MIGLAVPVVISGGAKLTGVRMMKSKFLIAATAATFALAGGVAMAQQDNNNPAPSYGRVSPVQSKNVQQIQDGNNAAPRYQAATGASSTAPTGAHATAKRRATHG